MSSNQPTAWRCAVCGYVHQGPNPPEFCPVCGAPQSEFEPYESPAARKPAAPTRWRCLNCNYVHEGPEPPDVCPVCGVEQDEFEAVAEPGAPASTTEDVSHVVIVGAGIAGVSAAEAARQAAPGCRITLVCGEAPLPYYRLNLTRYLAGEIESDALPIYNEEWYAEQNVELLSGRRVREIAPDEHTCTLSDSTVLSYDRLILAVGSHPFIPPLAGTELPGVVSLRTVADARRILDLASDGRACAVIGGGVLGLETAGALAQRGVPVTVLESHQWLMPRQLDSRAGAMLESHLRELGIGLLKEARSRAIVGSDAVEGVELEDGRVVPASMVVIATGVRPDTFLARKAGLEVNRGIVVDNHLRTSAPDIYAAGDVAEHNGVLYGIWGPSQYQGTIAGLNAVGVPTEFGGLPRSNSLKVLGLDLLSIGTFEPPDGSYRALNEEADGALCHFVFHDGRLVGAILMGDATLGPAVKKAIETGANFSALLSQTPTVAAVREALAQQG